MATLTWANIDFAANEITLITQKTGRTQVIPIAPPLLQHLASLAKPVDLSRPVHPDAAVVVRRTGRSGVLSKSFGDLLVRAALREEGLTPKDGNARVRYELSFHSLRHTATSLLKNAGIPASVVMSFVGHDTPSVSQGYTHSDKESMRKAADTFPTL